MALKTYNGFKHAQRMRALYWLRREYAAGRRQRPVVCDACGQDDGVIEAHSENYSEPFGDHIGMYALCYRCHMMVHCRFKNPQAWDTYKQHISEGRIFHAIDRSFARFCAETLRSRGKNVPFQKRPAREHTLLDDFTNASHTAPFDSRH